MADQRTLAEVLISLADGFATYGSDQRACLRWQTTKRDRTDCIVRAEVWEDAAGIVRSIVAGLGSGEVAQAIRTLLPTSIELPWSAGDMQDTGAAGTIYDAKAIPIAGVDGDREQAEAGCIAQAIVLAVNTACGFDTASNMKAA